MINRADIQSDGTTVSITSDACVKSSTKTLLTIGIMALIVLYVIFVFEIEIHHFRRLFIPTFIGGVLIVLFPLRFWFWKVFGKEKVIINAETITHFFDYGYFKAHVDVLPHNKLVTTFDFERKFNDEEYGHITFTSYIPETKKTKEICHTTVLLSKSEVNTIQELIEGISIVIA
jgi:hypothetical protein